MLYVRMRSRTLNDFPSDHVMRSHDHGAPNDVSLSYAFHLARASDNAITAS